MTAANALVRRWKQSGIEARRLPFQHAFRPLAFVAYVGGTAPTEDRAAIDRIVASVQPLPVPARGTYLGFAPARECGPTDERPLTWDGAVRQCAWDAYSAGVPFRWKLTTYTVEGDPTPIVLAFDGSLLHLTRDTRSDAFSTPQDRRISEWTCRTMSRQTWATDATRYSFALSGCTGESSSASVP